MKAQPGEKRKEGKKEGKKDRLGGGGGGMTDPTRGGWKLGQGCHDHFAVLHLLDGGGNLSLEVYGIRQQRVADDVGCGP